VGFIEGFRHLPGFLDERRQQALLASIREVARRAPLYTPAMPRTGRPLSVAMTNCGGLGWVTDKERGYRYQALHPVTGEAWPPIPDILLAVWYEVGGYPAPPEACLVNYYASGSKLGSHRDEDEEDFAAPVVSISLGDDAIFHVGGRTRAEPKTRMMLKSGDVVVLGGAARLAYHGIDRIAVGSSHLLAEGGRINLTLRRVTVPPA
jgi:alkylated DNA repair protein (DNA oxidative demethylase)